MSYSIYIEHNPFTVETVFNINDSTVNNCTFTETNKNRRLQLWVDRLFIELYELTNGATQFSLQFKGVEADWLDIKSAVKKAERDHRMSIQAEWIESEDSASRLEKMQTLMQEAKNHPVFKDKLSNTRSKIYTDFEAALNKDFDVYVAATMSAGKSTLINAMLGSDLLPAANEATTATIAQITDNDKMPYGEFHGRRFDKEDVEVDGLQKVSLETLKEWNSKTDTKRIELTGNIIGINERDHVRLVITDTPGPNNSQDPEHARTTMQHIQDSVRNPLILYILNATQLGTNDDQRVLGEISKIMQQGGKQSKDRFIFIVNKMDNFDPESGENVEDALGRVKDYLENNGIENPLIYPVSANLTRLLRKREKAPDSLTRKERGDLSAMEDLFTEEPSMDLVQYMSLSSTARNNLKARRLSIALERSGLPAIEAMINEYIDKYNLPNRVNRAYIALSEAIKVSSDENQLKANLEAHLENLDVIEQQLKTLRSNKDQSAKAKVKMEEVINDKKSLYPTVAIQKINEEEAKIRRIINTFQDDFVGNGEEITPSRAKRKIERLTQDINFESSRLINSLEQVIFEAQEITQQKLGEIFNNYVKDLFADLDGIPLPILDGLQAQISNIAMITGLGLNDDEIEERVTTERVKTGTKQEARREWVGTRKVSTSKWYNPFSWGSSREEDVYETRYHNVDVYEDVEKRTEYVDTDELWENREFEISHYFNELTKSATDKITNDIQEYANAFKDFMEAEFKVKFDEIISDLQSQVASKEKVEAEINQAKKVLQQIQDFKAKLENVLTL